MTLRKKKDFIINKNEFQKGIIQNQINIKKVFCFSGSKLNADKRQVEQPNPLSYHRLLSHVPPVPLSIPRRLSLLNQ